MPITRRQFVASATATSAAPGTLAGLASLGISTAATAAGPATGGTFILPPLFYETDALKVIDAKTMHIHHDRHHAGYVKKLNAALKGETYEPRSLKDLASNLDKFSEAKRLTIRNNGGGHVNHSLFWQSMAPPGEGGGPSPELERAMIQSFGSMDQAITQFIDASAAQFGSGWGWILVQPNGSLAISSTPNQDNPWMGAKYVETPGEPILGVDVWEHAYYLKYQNERKRYLEQFCTIINWNEVSKRYRTCFGS